MLIPAILLSASEAEYRNWLRINQSWLISESSIFCSLDFNEQQKLLHLREFLDMNKSSDFIVCKQPIYFEKGFLIHIARARAEFILGTATGRISGRNAGLKHKSFYGDDTPLMIHDKVIDWCPTPKFHAIACASLPYDFLWICSDLASILQEAAHACDTVEATFDLFYRSCAHSSDFAHLYLPEIRTFNPAELPNM